MVKFICLVFQFPLRLLYNSNIYLLVFSIYSDVVLLHCSMSLTPSDSKCFELSMLPVKSPAGCYV